MTSRLWPRIEKAHPIELLQIIHSNPLNTLGSQHDFLAPHGQFYDPPQDYQQLLNGHLQKHGSLRRSSIAFIPYFNESDGLNILLVKKASKNKAVSNDFPHANQFAFPGGMVPKDIDFDSLSDVDQEGVLLDSVVRELTEEIGGIVEDGIFPLYQLPSTQTNTSFVHVHPFVIYLGRTEAKNLFIKDTTELEELHHVNLHDLTKNFHPSGVVEYASSSPLYKGPTFHLSSLESPIWGLTARILAYVLSEIELVLERQEHASHSSPSDYLKSLHQRESL
mmetsp:Transcript_12412/g.18561  ORF Transcript_12412/g.18561 Transcript_12412/m.18561 type:complete len:278 (-) Transcript_12412:29-862(-)|eukprot:CAMPEP_0117425758 /NCGR_PEP_ID=MMETSP0758-20121206/5996_1 /TAXON_ID=63605 /ORGANISM="Percolomonas cosmopolitus, Strain AE-1 (ATCC 50343)" /LENGTH=277 /DNA_ID=CAMNT_0005210495 /DNA_START=31 /DNA_END=864 /DNA_ORIENTATION=-